MMQEERSNSEQIERMKKDRFICGLVGITLDEAGAGYARASLVLRENHLNGVGIVQGGVLFSIADYAFAAAANWDEPVVGIETHMTFINAAKTGTIYAEAKETARTGKFSVCEVKVTDEGGKLLAIFTARGYILKNKD